MGIAARKQFQEFEKKTTIDVEINGEVDEKVVVWGKLYDQGIILYPI